MPEKKRSGKHLCPRCGKEIHGKKRFLEGKLKKFSASEKKTERVFGGYYCASCTREILRENARKI